jgi:hypothetical protein
MQEIYKYFKRVLDMIIFFKTFKEKVSVTERCKNDTDGKVKQIKHLENGENL